MGIIFLLLAGAVYIASIGCWLFILVEAFKDELWKGFVALLCGLYWLYYALFEFEHEYKWQIVIGALAGGAVATGLARMA